MDKGGQEKADGHQGGTRGDQSAGSDPVDQATGKDPSDPIGQNEDGHAGGDDRPGPVVLQSHRLDKDTEAVTGAVVDPQDEKGAQHHIPAPVDPVAFVPHALSSAPQPMTKRSLDTTIPSR